VRIQERSEENGKIIGYINGYRKGGFEYNFVLTDSLKLSLDDDYYISLEDPSALKYDLDKYDGGDEEKYLANRKLYAAGKFRFEQYELKSTTFNIRTDKQTHEPGNPLSVFLKAIDENDLPVQDGRLELTLLTRQVGALRAEHVFVPDTLWNYKLPLEPLGETKVTVPDSIFPRADIKYEIDADFLNTDNEHKDDRRYVEYNDINYKIKTDLNADTLKVTGLLKGKAMKMAANIYAINNTGDTVSTSKVMLPAAIVIGPAINRYIVRADSAAVTTNIAGIKSDLEFAGYQTADSLFIKVSNPHNIHFWYWLTSNNKLIDEGETNSLFYKKKYTDKGSLVFVLSYIWGGQTKITGMAIPYQDKLLTINVKQPVSVYPGQQVKMEIEVKDALGKPVANTDITAWSITRKFTDYRAPFVPYLGKMLEGYRVKLFQDVHKSDYSGSLPLNWAKWRGEIGLDSIEYYKFTHPTTIYKIEEPAPDSITQIAPFVVQNGDIDDTHILFIDERPVYFDQAQQLSRYSFRVLPGRHSLRFRTTNQTITLDSVYAEKGKKLILSINEDTVLNKTAHFKKMPDTLLRYESELLNKYLFRVVDNFGANMAVIQQQDQLLLLNPNPQSGYNNSNQVLIGPLANNNTSFSLKGKLESTFLAEPGYSYLFEPGFLKQKSINTKYAFTDPLFFGLGTKDYRQYPLTRTEVDSMWNHYLELRSHTTPLFRNDAIKEKITGKLSITINSSQLPASLIKNIIIYKDDDADFIRIFPGNETNLGMLAPGNYRLFFLLEQNNYYIKNSVAIKPNGTNYYQVEITPHQKDAVSTKMDSVIINRTARYQPSDNNIENDALKLKEAFNDKYIDKGNFKNTMYGVVIGNDDKLPIIGCTVKVKGTSHGVTSDIHGRFSIKVPPSGSLLVMYIGYQPQQVVIRAGGPVTIRLNPTESMLNEVVVIGYGTQMKRDLTGSVSTVTDGGPGSSVVVNIRGLSQFQEKKPLIIVDGVEVDSMDGLDQAAITEITTLKDVAAAAIYGARGANGVVIITTKKKGGKANPADTSRAGDAASIRKNFSDYAYWQPRLTTDAEGKASFTTTFPDDITNWRTFVIGINDKQQSGFADNQVKSFKPLSAQLAIPQFAVVGDELTVIGKVLNYGVDPVKLARTFSYNNTQLKQGLLDVKNSKIDTLNVVAANTDSLTFAYTIKRDNGYFDGEMRKIPVIAKGTQETKGIFQVLNGDTTITMNFDPTLGPVTLRAEASVLPVLAEEAKHLREYRYLCNEQLASKLKGLLAEKRIRTYLGEPFKYEKNILDVIDKLQENRRSQGTWGWWKDTDEELWISLHAIEALTGAQKAGYTIDIDLPKLIEYLVYQLESYKGADKLTCLELLHKLNAKVDYPKYVNVVSKEFAVEKDISRYDRFRLMLLQGEMGLPVKMDSILLNEHRTLFGNIYWGEDSYRFFDNSVQLSVLAYKILKNEGKHQELLEKIRGYFLEQRRSGEWRNTYESSLILETILPDLLKESKQVKPASITITGAKTETITSFPYTTTLTDNQLNISKTGSLPVYITGYQQFWNSNPEKVGKDFNVDTWFEKNGNKLAVLKGGEQVQLKAEITAKGDADYVMIEIPIPAGCSYESKQQSWENNEVHREYFKEKVSIFCRKLKQGKYEFTVNLIPRYDGKYSLNPAKAEMMYFPVFYGREGMKAVVIGSLAH